MKKNDGSTQKNASPSGLCSVDEAVTTIGNVTHINISEVAAALYEAKEKTGGTITKETLALTMEGLTPEIEKAKAPRVLARIELQEMEGKNTVGNTIKAISTVSGIENSDVALAFYGVQKEPKAGASLDTIVTTLKTVYTDAVMQDLSKPPAERAYNRGPSFSGRY